MDTRIAQEFKDKTVLVTGGTGSIGSELVRQVLTCEPKQVRVYSRSENMQHQLRNELGADAPAIYLIGDIRDKERLSFAFKGVDIVLHAAAMKHVHLCEYNPFEAVKTNVVGSQNVIDAAIERNVKKVIGISTDKAANPAGVLGTSKLMMEKLLINANNYTRPEATKFACVRFGNVIWSAGSVLPTWQEQAKRDKQIGITDAEMTRFFMSKEDAISLVLKAATLARGGELFTFNMPAINLKELAEMFIEKYFQGEAIEIVTVGNRGGEKTHEELFDAWNLSHDIYTNDDLFIFVTHEKLKGLYEGIINNSQYEGFERLVEKRNIVSHECIDRDRIRRYL